jgi:trypsin
MKVNKLVMAMTTVLLGVATSTAVQASDVKFELKRNQIPKIVGGDQTPVGERPWMVSLQGDGSHFCGASLIDAQWVLTAAHCVEDIDQNNLGSLQIRANFTDLHTAEGSSSKVAKVFIHQDYNQQGKAAADVALLRLVTPITDVQPIQLADAEFMAEHGLAGTLASVSGWGVTQEDGDIPNLMQKVAVPLVTNEVCNSPDAYNGEIANTELCAGFAEGGKDSCQGDSGGPLVLPFNNGFVQAGVVSWGDGCARPNKYGVYARVESFHPWINNLMAGNEDTDPDTDTGTEQPDDGSLISGVALTQISGEQDSEQVFMIQVPEQAQILWIDIRGNDGDADLFVSFAQEPSVDDADYAPYLDGSNEHVMVRRPQAGTWYIKLAGYTDYSELELMAFAR